LSGSRAHRGYIAGAGRKFPANHYLFANAAAAVIPERSSLANNAVTRDNTRDWVRTERAADCSRGFRLSDRFCKSSVSCERTGWNSQQRAPNTDLKRRAADE